MRYLPLDAENILSTDGNDLVVGHDVVVLVTSGDLKSHVVAFRSFGVLVVLYCIHNLLYANSYVNDSWAWT